MIKSLTAAAITALSMATAAPAVAGGPVVVELFTSQGCSSCPPADELLGEIAKRNDIIALSMHVDYWDYLGWVDEFASPENTTRQRGYARQAQSTMIYTPQMVVAGQDHIIGTKGMELASKIDVHKSKADSVSLKVKRDASGKLSIAAHRTGDVPSKMQVQVIRYIAEQKVDIRRGENAGRTITYHNVVESVTPIGTWNGDADLKVKADAPGDYPAVVLIQDGPFGAILAAARVE
ncbi:MAG: DUF1223 domain-containing protein [Litoreibacter sp.]|uniref:DUF1223 domain-containing protein n=1 Tax=Litoreibacter sp. TaxID=1969459 RepID=UPI003297F7A6